jgi:hypothetical protein
VVVVVGVVVVVVVVRVVVVGVGVVVGVCVRGSRAPPRGPFGRQRHHGGAGA